MFRLFRLVPVLTLLLVVTPDAELRYPYRTYGVGVGVAFGPGGYYGAYGFPAFGIFPGAYDGFWSNGMSLYGPPIPTHAPIPGVFGGTDQRFHAWGGWGYGLWWGGYRSPSPRPRPNFDYHPPVRPFPGSEGIVVPQSEPAPPPRLLPMDEKGEKTAAQPMRFTVKVPENAKVFIDDRPTRQTGSARAFESAALAADESAAYRVRAEWVEGGRTVTRSRVIAGIGGQALTVDFAAGE